jgi:trehalose 6-phosphate phosphatase
MRVLNPELELDRFFTQLARARNRVLLADYDGTIAPFHPLPMRAAPYRYVARALNGITRLARTRLVLVSGRPLAELESAAARLNPSDAWGAHGWQRRAADGTVTVFAAPAESLRQFEEAGAALVGLALHGARVERKVASIAVHWRGLDHDFVVPVERAVLGAWQMSRWPALDLLSFDGGLELRIRGRNKGDAVRQVLQESGPGTVCAYLGDDRTDEDAFQALAGKGLGVLVRPALRETSADLWLVPPRELVVFLDRWRNCTQHA